MNHYMRGQWIKLRAIFTDEGAPVVPTSITCSVQDPSGQVSEISTTNPSPGVYEAEIEADEVGFWTYQFEGTGDASGIEEESFTVRDRRIP